MAKKTTKAAAKAPAKISPSKKPRTKGELYSTIAEHTQLSRKQVASVFDTMGRIIAADLTKGASEVLNIAGLMKVTVVRKPATKARKGKNPFTGEEITIKAKPASRKVRIRAMKGLNDSI